MKRKAILNVFFTLILILTGLTCALSQDLPAKPVPPRLVNDFAGFLSPGEQNILEHKLVAFDDSTSTQITIVIVKDLKGYDKADYAQRLGEKWGIGRKQLNNGILILVKPKTADSQGDVQIAQGYGLEGAIPDPTCAQVVDNDILPAFRRGDYYGGLNKATTTLMALARGEYSAAQYGKNIKTSRAKSAPIGFFIVILFIMIILRSSGRSNHNNISRTGLPFWMLMGMMNSGRNSHNGSWGGFSGGGGFGGGGGGGFGGFGGGSFGGGGAGGSW
jgi:uncharacterized protein